MQLHAYNSLKPVVSVRQEGRKGQYQKAGKGNIRRQERAIPDSRKGDILSQVGLSLVTIGHLCTLANPMTKHEAIPGIL